MSKKIILLTTRSCPYCPVAKEFWRKLRSKYAFELEEVDAFTPEGQKLVEEFNISSVPTSILEENGLREVIFIGIPDEENVRKLFEGVNIV